MNGLLTPDEMARDILEALDEATAHLPPEGKANVAAAFMGWLGGSFFEKERAMKNGAPRK
jgi:hypothetical protein